MVDRHAYRLAVLLKSQVTDGFYYEDHVYLEQARGILKLAGRDIKREFLERICEALEHNPYAEFLWDTFKDEVSLKDEVA